MISAPVLSNNSNSDGPQGYTRCAGENQSYTFSGTVDVAYECNGHFSYRQGVSGTINFNNGTFGDPIPGTLKSGYYKASGGSGGGTITDIVNTLSPADEKKILTWMLGEASDAQSVIVTNEVTLTYRRSDHMRKRI
ncbi:MAG: hypothetical protein U0X76_08715 [Bacteroidia bacterium]